MTRGGEAWREEERDRQSLLEEEGRGAADTPSCV